MSESIELSPTPDSVAVARRWSSDVLGRTGLDDLADTMALLVSELVTNVVLHAGTPCSLSIAQTTERVRVEVDDDSEALPKAAGDRDRYASSGRGLVLLEGLSAAHGVDARPGGKRVWFELEIPR